MPASVLPLLGGGQARVCGAGGLPWSLLWGGEQAATVPRESLRGLPLAWGLGRGGFIWGEVQAGTGCLLATSLCCADLPCDLGMFAHLPALPPHLVPHEVPWGRSRHSPWAVDPARPGGCAAVLGSHTPVRSVSMPFLAAVFPSQAAGAPGLQESASVLEFVL